MGNGPSNSTPALLTHCSCLFTVPVQHPHCWPRLSENTGLNTMQLYYMYVSLEMQVTRYKYISIKRNKLLEKDDTSNIITYPDSYFKRCKFVSPKPWCLPQNMQHKPSGPQWPCPFICITGQWKCHQSNRLRVIPEDKWPENLRFIPNKNTLAHAPVSEATVDFRNLQTLQSPLQAAAASTICALDSGTFVLMKITSMRGCLHRIIKIYRATENTPHILLFNVKPSSKMAFRAFFSPPHFFRDNAEHSRSAHTIHSWCKASGLHKCALQYP